MAEQTGQTRKWSIIAPFFDGQGDGRWLDDFIDRPDLQFRKIASPAGARGDWHHGRSKTTDLRGWLGYLRHAAAAFRGRPDGIITSFPQLAMCAGAIKRLTGRRVPIVAYNYNVWTLAPGRKRQLARWSARAIDLFVVHSPSEIAPYAAYFDLPPERFRFVPLQRGTLAQRRDEDTEAPFVLAMGSAHRDYPLLLRALAPLGLRTIIVARADEAAALGPAPGVEFRSGLSREECLELLARARLSVTPIANTTTASGQITFINAMQLGVAVIATDCPGTEGYVENGRTGLLVPPGDEVALREAIAALWSEPERREALAQAGRAHAERYFSDQGAAQALEAITLSLGR